MVETKQHGKSRAHGAAVRHNQRIGWRQAGDCLAHTGLYRRPAFSTRWGMGIRIIPEGGEGICPYIGGRKTIPFPEVEFPPAGIYKQGKRPAMRNGFSGASGAEEVRGDD